MAKAGARVKITLRCSECKQRNYDTMKNKKNTSDRLELNKYCPFCRKHTKHSETKQVFRKECDKWLKNRRKPVLLPRKR